MSKEKYPANSISFSWAPTPYPMRWAESPEDVPEWDASRGCPLGVHSKHLKTWDVLDAPSEGYPRLVRLSLDGLIAPRNRVKNDPVNDTMAISRYLEPAREGRQLKNLKNAVLKLAEEYGSPGRHDENTIHKWLALTYYVQTYVWALHALSDGFDLIQQSFLDCRALIHLQTRAKREGWAEVRLDGHVVQDRHPYKGVEGFTALAAMLDSLNKLAKSPHFRDSRQDEPDEDDPIWGELIALEELLRYANKTEDDVLEPKKRLAAFRLAVARGLYNKFGKDVAAYKDSEGLPLHFIPTAEWGIVLWCPLNIWIRFKLSELWRHNVEVKACPVCGTLFAPTHGNAKYCKTNGPCANKAFRLKPQAARN